MFNKVVRIFGAAMLFIVVAISTLAVPAAHAQQSTDLAGLADLPCLTVTNSDGSKNAISPSVPGDWLRLPMKSYNGFITALNNAGLTFKAGSQIAATVKANFPNYKCAAAEPNGNGVLIVMQIDKAAYEQETGQTLSYLITNNGTPVQLNGRPAGFVITDLDTFTEVDMIALVANNSNVAFDIISIVSKDYLAANPDEMSESAVSLRLDTEDIDLDAAAAVQDALGLTPTQPTATPVPIRKPTKTPKAPAGTPSGNGFGGIISGPAGTAVPTQAPTAAATPAATTSVAG